MKPRHRLSGCNLVIAVLSLVIALLGLGVRDTARAADAPTTAAMLANAPVFQLILDISGSSPAFDQNLIDSVAPVIVDKLNTMPVGTLVTIATAGDATQPASLLRMRIEARRTTASDVARKLQRFLHDFPAQAKGHEQGRSDLVGGFASAASAINRNSDANEIWFITDLVEYSNVADCSRSRRCALPAKPSFDLSGAHVHVYGVGQGLPSDRAMQLTEDWRAFLVRARARDAELRRF